MQIKHFIQKSSLKEIGQQFKKTKCKKKTTMFYQEQFQLLQTGHKVRGNFKRKPKNKTALHMQIT